jgi:hypothetical protein
VVGTYVNRVGGREQAILERNGNRDRQQLPFFTAYQPVTHILNTWNRMLFRSSTNSSVRRTCDAGREFHNADTVMCLSGVWCRSP